ncbi:ERF family protein [Basfia succiniciproducens]|uniref:ERF family protein n=1 Tax=Basfia succiniciproducens TaxID=653940 RepID=UPI0008D7A0CF|nr:ERF family protein [Basfia succiniciproducens]SEQ64994.1 ERF superfamily protein [Basfia succiniciproducens]
MSIYSKLAEARVELQKRGVKQSGANTFSKYTYFELGDFLPAINEIFAAKKLCGVVSFTAEIATLTIHDGESNEKIEFTSPMATAQLKGCHEIQNLGAVQTYQRRYLYMAALEISEYDVLDENRGNESAKTENKQRERPQTSNNIDPKVVLNGYKKAMSDATTLEMIDKYKKSITAKLNKYPNELKEAVVIYNERKQEIQGGTSEL